uniref:uncharacterized protein LOC113475230 n=1 Tax=Ciona intestinalis TaxID=7719 RepID=UPI000EF44866|nr:uncharacterized protein LOC113475230 [Ciona intestinalis]|eukprot:XP_026694980.1 uncharacterized protein LOC113475230 [Ciona intestinalis]
MEIIETSPIVPLITDPGFSGTVRRAMTSVRGGWSAAWRRTRSVRVQPLNIVPREVVPERQWTEYPAVNVLPPMRKFTATPLSASNEDETSVAGTFLVRKKPIVESDLTIIDLDTSVLESPVQQEREVSSFLAPEAAFPEVLGVSRTFSTGNIPMTGKFGDGVRRPASYDLKNRAVATRDAYYCMVESRLHDAVGTQPITVNDDFFWWFTRGEELNIEFAFMRCPSLLAGKPTPAPITLYPKISVSEVWTPQKQIKDLFVYNLKTMYNLEVHVPEAGDTAPIDEEDFPILSDSSSDSSYSSSDSSLTSKKKRISNSVVPNWLLKFAVIHLKLKKLIKTKKVIQRRQSGSIFHYNFDFSDVTSLADSSDVGTLDCNTEELDNYVREIMENTNDLDSPIESFRRVESALQETYMAEILKNKNKKISEQRIGNPDQEAGEASSSGIEGAGPGKRFRIEGDDDDDDVVRPAGMFCAGMLPFRKKKRSLPKPKRSAGEPQRSVRFAVPKTEAPAPPSRPERRSSKLKKMFTSCFGLIKTRARDQQ